MRILQVVTYISPDGAYGGPTRVALGQAEALASRGHEVTVIAGSPSDRPSRTEVDGYVLHTFPAKKLARRLGFAGLFSPRMIQHLRKGPSWDVAHIHLARDLVTLPAARILHRQRIPYVIQTHGMIDHSTRVLAHLLDAGVTGGVLRNASVGFTLTPHETLDLEAVQPRVTTLQINNGVKLQPLPPYADRAPLVLFLARLHPRKRALAFVEMARLLSLRLPDARFVIAGPDEGDGDAVQAAIANSGMGERLRWVGAVSPDQTAETMRSASVYVLPSQAEVFPMAMLEAFREGTPVVTTADVGIAAKCQEYGAAILTDGTPEALASATLSIMTDPEVASALRTGAQRFVSDELDIGEIVQTLEREYLRARDAHA